MNHRILFSIVPYRTFSSSVSSVDSSSSSVTVSPSSSPTSTTSKSSSGSSNSNHQSSSSSSSSSSSTVEPRRVYVKSTPLPKSKRSNPLFRYGAPLVFFIVVGYGILSQFVENRVQITDTKQKKQSERTVQLEMAHKAIVGRMELQDYEIKPINRPGENSNSNVLR